MEEIDVNLKEIETKEKAENYLERKNKGNNQKIPNKSSTRIR
jgi:hypothetical protein